MKFWQAVSYAEPEQLVEIARIAEQVGFHGILVSDHLFFPEKLESRYPYAPDGRPGFDAGTPWPDTWTTIASMAAVTRKLRFASMVYILPLRHPLEVAKATSTLALLSGNRVILGAGAGWMKEEFDALGVDFHTRGRRFDEMIELLRKLWKGGMVEHHGAFFDFARIQMSPAPPAPIPIYIGGASDAAFRRAARLGDGWIGSGNDPDEVPALMERLRSLRRSAGREGLPFEAIVPTTRPLDAAGLRRLEDQGVGGTVSYPFSYALGPRSTLDQKRAYLERYGSELISRI